MSIKLMLVDDHTIVRHGLSRSFKQGDEIEVVGQANDGRTAVELAGQLSPDVIIMDIAMPDLNGVDATRQITNQNSKVKVIGLSMHSGSKYVREMFRAGASGYLLKDCPFEELVEAIKTVAGGKTYVSPSIGEMVIKEYVSDQEEEKSAFSVLSAREREVLQLLAEGKTTKQCGKRLHISPKTVEAHRLKIMEKLGINNTAQLTKYAIQEGLTRPEP
jgi:two-component system, NarL family, response regulator NreC